MNLKERCKKFQDVLGVPITHFCKRIGISVTAYNAWQRDKLALSQGRESKIEKFISQFNF